MAGFKVFTVGEVLTASNVNTYFAQTNHVFKSATESVTSSATLQNDDALLFSVAADTNYMFRFLCSINSAANAAGDINIGFSFPASGVCYFYGIGPHNSLVSGSQVDGEFIVREGATSGTTATPYGCSTTGNTAIIEGYLDTAGTAGTLQLMWAQQASNANATNLRLGSQGWIYKVS